MPACLLRTMKSLPGDRVDYEVRASSTVTSQVPLQPKAAGQVSAMYQLRTLPLRDGFTTTIRVVSNGKNYRVRTRVDGREMMTTDIGATGTWRLSVALDDEKGPAGDNAESHVVAVERWPQIAGPGKRGPAGRKFHVDSRERPTRSLSLLRWPKRRRPAREASRTALARHGGVPTIWNSGGYA